ncbi:MAG: NRDE family protein, partial [Solibacillus sp.]|uniref:NRDE family protein n=1 Tax=Solibacillus sp. TaxID=1909654 RepID=UPI003315AB44
IIESGIYGVSNATFNTPWPKVNSAKTVLEHTVNNEAVKVNTLISLLANDEIALDEVLPNTGVGIHLERSLSAQFVKLPNYGTRCSTAIVFHNNGEIDFLERTYEDGKYKFDRSYRIDAGE